MYIGTSSVSGRRKGLILEEDLEAGQEFINTYERSKHESERLVRDVAYRLPIVILRPSIVIGDSRSGATTLFNAIYIPLRLLHRVLDSEGILFPRFVDYADRIFAFALTTDWGKRLASG